jgi:hypothetical protein
MEQAQTLFEEEGIEAVVRKKGGKRGRGKEEDEESLEEKIIAEAELLSAKVAEKDKYLLELEGRREKALDDIKRYKEKATLAKDLLKGAAATKKNAEIKEKLKQLNKLLLVLQELNTKRMDDIYTAALEEVSAIKHPAKKRRTGASTMSSDSEGDELDVSEGKQFSLIFCELSIPSPSLDDRPKLGGRPICSDDAISMQKRPSVAIRGRFSRSSAASPSASLGSHGPSISSHSADILHRITTALLHVTSRSLSARRPPLVSLFVPQRLPPLVLGHITSSCDTLQAYDARSSSATSPLRPLYVPSSHWGSGLVFVQPEGPQPPSFLSETTKGSFLPLFRSHSTHSTRSIGPCACTERTLYIRSQRRRCYAPAPSSCPTLYARFYCIFSRGIAPFCALPPFLRRWLAKRPRHFGYIPSRLAPVYIHCYTC